MVDILELIKSGYAGMQQDGKIVDRRQYPEAIAIQANQLLGVPEPLPVEKKDKDDD